MTSQNDAQAMPRMLKLYKHLAKPHILQQSLADQRKEWVKYQLLI